MATHVSLGFAKLNDAELVEFAIGVHDKLAANTNSVFSKVVIQSDPLDAATKKFQSDLAAANKGGVAQTVAKDASRAALIEILRQMANGVQGAANGDENVILSSGFKTAHAGNAAQSPLPKPVITAILNETSTQLLVRVTPLPNAKTYEVQISTDSKTFQPAGSYTQARRIILENLTPGTTYTIHVRGIGGSTGYSDWSDPVSHMAT